MRAVAVAPMHALQGEGHARDVHHGGVNNLAVGLHCNRAKYPGCRSSFRELKGERAINLPSINPAREITDGGRTCYVNRLARSCGGSGPRLSVDDFCLSPAR